MWRAEVFLGASGVVLKNFSYCLLNTERAKRHIAYLFVLTSLSSPLFASIICGGVFTLFTTVHFVCGNDPAARPLAAALPDKGFAREHIALAVCKVVDGHHAAVAVANLATPFALPITQFA